MTARKFIALVGISFALSLPTFADSTNKIVAAKNYTQQEIDAFNRKAEHEYHHLGKQLDDLKHQAEKTTDDARVAMDKKIAAAQQKADDLKPKLHQLKTATTNAWADVRDGFEKGLADFRDALK